MGYKRTSRPHPYGHEGERTIPCRVPRIGCPSCTIGHEKAPHNGGASPHPVAFIGFGDAARMQLRRDAICGFISEKGLIPRFRYASSKIHGQVKRFCTFTSSAIFRVLITSAALRAERACRREGDGANRRRSAASMDGADRLIEKAAYSVAMDGRQKFLESIAVGSELIIPDG